jgi:hypothetical protein
MDHLYLGLLLWSYHDYLDHGRNHLVHGLQNSQ